MNQTWKKRDEKRKEALMKSLKAINTKNSDKPEPWTRPYIPRSVIDSMTKSLQRKRDNTIFGILRESFSDFQKSH